jgi:hypothetical protein
MVSCTLFPGGSFPHGLDPFGPGRLGDPPPHIIETDGIVSLEKRAKYGNQMLCDADRCGTELESDQLAPWPARVYSSPDVIPAYPQNYWDR